MIVAVGFFIAVLFVSFLSDSLASSAGVRWNRWWAWLAVAVGATFGGVLGWLDGGATPAKVGAVLGLVFGQIAGTIVFGTNAMFAALIFGPRPVDSNEPRLRCSFLRQIAILVAGPLPIALAVVAAHEIYWMTNMLSSHAQYHVGLAMVEAEPTDSGRKALAMALKKTRWRLDVGTHQPIRWMLHSEDETTLRGTLAYVDFLNGRPAPNEMPAAWKNSSEDAMLWIHWREKTADMQSMTADRLEKHGAKIGNAAYAQLNRHLDRTWILRYLPRAIFLNQNARQAKEKSPAGFTKNAHRTPWKAGIPVRNSLAQR